MSTMIQAKCWPLQMPPTPKSVLISLADNANDDGECWPSIQTIAIRTCFSERAIQNAIKWLEDHKIVVADRANGRHTKYQLSPESYIEELPTPAGGAPVPPQQMHPNPRTSCTPTPAADAGVPPQEVRQPPQQMRLPPQEVPSNHQEPSKNRKGNIKGADFVLPHWIPAKAWDGYLEMRNQKKKIPTDHARDLVIAELLKLKGQGQDIEAVLNKSIVNGWTDVYAIKGVPVSNSKSQSQLDQENEAAYAMLFGKSPGAIDA